MLAAGISGLGRSPVVCLMLGLWLALPVSPPVRAESAAGDMQAVLNELPAVRALSTELDMLMVRLSDGGAAFDLYLSGQTSLAAALATGREKVAGVADELAPLAVRAEALRLPASGNADYDEQIRRQMRLVRTKPDGVRRYLATLNAQIAAAEAGDNEEMGRLSVEMGSINLVMLDNEIGTLNLALVSMASSHPQHGMTRAMIAAGEGMRTITLLGVTTDNNDWRALVEALPGDLSAAHRKMDVAIGDSRAALAEVRKESPWAPVFQGLFGRSEQAEMLSALWVEYDQALAVEEEIADHLYSGAGLFERLAHGEQSDELFAAMRVFDERTKTLFLRRISEAADRLALIRKAGLQ